MFGLLKKLFATNPSGNQAAAATTEIPSVEMELIARDGNVSFSPGGVTDDEFDLSDESIYSGNDEQPEMLTCLISSDHLFLENGLRLGG